MALKQLCPDVNFRNPYVDSENMFQMHTIWQPFPPPVRPELDEANGIIGEEAANPRFSYQMFKLMRASHEGELDYFGLSDDTRDCEVTVFTGCNNAHTALLVLINRTIKMKRGLCLRDRPTEATEITLDLLCSAVNPNTELFEEQSGFQEIYCHFYTKAVVLIDKHINLLIFYLFFSFLILSENILKNRAHIQIPM